ncbi:MAG: hypothetical protein Q4G64_08000 [bacterium]|nr:hypothetical protein [bacterium]
MRTGTRILLGIAAVKAVALVGIGAALAAGVHRRLGTTAAENASPLPGDDLVPDATIQNDRATTISAPPEKVWPWLAQIGQDKAGFYSFEALENAMGCEISGAEHINPQWQDVQVGDLVTLAPGMGIRVAAVRPGSHLVLTSEGGEYPADAEGKMDFDFTWTFRLVPVADADGEPATRVHVRERYRPHDRSTSRTLHAVAVGSAIMTWKMLRNIRRLAESH